MDIKNTNRREFLRVGSIAGLSLAQIMRMQELCASETAKQDINCIFMFILGGMPHQDMWDLKPDAPVEIRGDFQPISTSAPGIQISDVLPKTSKVVDKLAILRSLTHQNSVHQDGFHIMMTGKAPTPNLDRNNKNNNQHPSLGSVIARLGKQGTLPPYISLPNFIDSGGPSFLGPSYGPFVIDADPAAPEFEVRDITLPAGVTSQRNFRRQAALREINRFEQDVEKVDQSVKALDSFYQKAFGVMTSREAKEAFDINAGLPDIEPLEILERLEFLETGVGHFCAVEVQVLQLLQGSKLCESGVGHSGLFQMQLLERRQLGQLGQPGIGHLGAPQIEDDHVFQIGQRCQEFVRHVAVRQVISDVEAAVVLGNFHHLPAQFTDLLDRGLFGVGTFRVLSVRRECDGTQQCQCQDGNHLPHRSLPVLRWRSVLFSEESCSAGRIPVLPGDFPHHPLVYHAL